MRPKAETECSAQADTRFRERHTLGSAMLASQSLDYRSSTRNALFGVLLGAVLGAGWLSLVFLLGPPSGPSRFKHLLAIYLGWIIPTALLLGYGYLLIARPVILRLDDVGVRWRPLFRERILSWEMVGLVHLHRFKKRRRLVLGARPVDPATHARIAALLGPWSRTVNAGDSLTIANSFHVLPLDDIAAAIAHRARPPLTPIVIDFPSAKSFDGQGSTPRHRRPKRAHSARSASASYRAS
jgi:hypothetical protein